MPISLPHVLACGKRQIQPSWQWQRFQVPSAVLWSQGWGLVVLAVRRPKQSDLSAAFLQDFPRHTISQQNEERFFVSTSWNRVEAAPI